MSHILEDPELRKLFQKNGWRRICNVCGDFLGNTANWIIHMKTHLHVEAAEVGRKQQISFCKNRHDEEDRNIEMTEMEVAQLVLLLPHLNFEQPVVSEEECLLPEYKRWSTAGFLPSRKK